MAPLEAAAKFDPQNAEAHALLGTAYQYTRESDNALEAYKKAVQARAAEHRLPLHLRAAARAEQEVRPGHRRAEEGRGDARLQGRRGLGEPGLGLPEHGAAQRAGVRSRPTEGARDRPEERAGRPRPGLGALAISATTTRRSPPSTRPSSSIRRPRARPSTGSPGATCFKKDLAQAKTFVEKAKAAGRNDARLIQTIEKFEKGMAAAADAEKEFREEQEERAGRPGRRLRSAARSMRGGPAAKKNAMPPARSASGAPAVEFLRLSPRCSDRRHGRARGGDQRARRRRRAARGASARSSSASRGGTRTTQTVMDKKQMEQMGAVRGPAPRGAKAARWRRGSAARR